MSNLRIKSIILLFILPLAAGAQKTMTLDEAIMQALENNYSLKISRNDETIADNNVSISPFLPTLTGTGRQSQTTNNAASSATGTDKTRTNAYNAGLSLNWRLFVGFGMFTDYSRQKELLAMSSQRVKINVENLIMRVCSEYYNIIVQQNRMESALT
mgnify:CR=1 FL=1